MRKARARINVPDVVGFDAVEAAAMVQAAGLTPSGPDHTAAPNTGTVTEQDPAATTRAAPGAAVALSTGLGRASTLPGGNRTDPAALVPT